MDSFFLLKSIPNLDRLLALPTGGQNCSDRNPVMIQKVPFFINSAVFLWHGSGIRWNDEFKINYEEVG